MRWLTPPPVCDSSELAGLTSEIDDDSDSAVPAVNVLIWLSVKVSTLELDSVKGGVGG